MHYSLKSCVWEITLACCFQCRYCGSSGGCAREDELTTEECLSVAGQLQQLHCRRVSLIGGEVFMRPDWETIVRKLTSSGIRVNIITNGFLFTPALIGRLKKARVESVSVSLDGPEEIHDKYRQTGSFARAIQAVDDLTRADIPVSVITTLNRENAETLDELYKLLYSRPIFAWQLQACAPMGNAAKSGIDYRFSFRKVIDFVESRRRTAPFALGIADNIGYYTETEGFLRGVQSREFRYTGCRAGLTSIGIDSSGNVRGCEALYDERFNEGNVRDRSLKDIWEDPGAFSYNRSFTPDLLTGACASCKEAFRCAGGCRSYNYFVHGKLYESPACARNETTSAARPAIKD